MVLSTKRSSTPSRGLRRLREKRATTTARTGTGMGLAARRGATAALSVLTTPPCSGLCTRRSVTSLTCPCMIISSALTQPPSLLSPIRSPMSWIGPWHGAPLTPLNTRTTLCRWLGTADRLAVKRRWPSPGGPLLPKMG
jgi:hypothetical protein